MGFGGAADTCVYSPTQNQHKHHSLPAKRATWTHKSLLRCKRALVPHIKVRTHSMQQPRKLLLVPLRGSLKVNLGHLPGMCWAPALPNAVCRSNTLKMMISISVGRVEKVFESVGKCFLFQPIRAPHALSPRLALAPILCCAASGERERERTVTSPALFTRGQAPPTDGDTHTHTHTHQSSASSPQLSAINSARSTQCAESGFV